jgi:hypothetical protein
MYQSRAATVEWRHNLIGEKEYAHVTNSPSGSVIPFPQKTKTRMNSHACFFWSGRGVTASQDVDIVSECHFTPDEQTDCLLSMLQLSIPLTEL